MADNTDEEHVDNPVNKEPEIPADQIFTPTDSKTINPNQETENMEVHHHTHTSHGKKTWKSYFWEFLMLFLAVFCGYLAEYQLEHKIEREKANQYILSFYEDLKSDTAEFASLINMYKEKLTVFKSRKACFDSMPNQVKLCNPCIAELFDYSDGFKDFVNEDRTILQLKNAGGLRLLKPEDADSILAYDKMIRVFIKNETTGTQELQYRVRELTRSMRNYKSLTLTKEDCSAPFLKTGNMDDINKFFVLLDEYNTTCDIQCAMLKKLLKRATRLVAYFKSKYNLE